MPIEQLDFFTYFDRQRFTQYGPRDAANWTLTPIESGKKQNAMYPVLGRKHITVNGQNRLQFATEPRAMFRSVNFAYIVVGSSIYQVQPDNLTANAIDGGKVTTHSGIIDFDYIVTPATTYVGFTDGQNMFVFDESTSVFDLITDADKPDNPQYIVNFGDRFVVAGLNSSEFRLTAINALSGTTPATIFSSQPIVPFAQERGNIKGFGVLHNTLYIFTDFSTGIWSNNPSVFDNATFPFRKNTTFSWDYGLLDVRTLAIDFGMMVFLAQNKSGLIQVMVTQGQAPEPLSTKAVDILFESSLRDGSPSPFVTGEAAGFLYQYENTVFYRLSAGLYIDKKLLEKDSSAASIEYSFFAQSWHRVIERNTMRGRVQHHTFFTNRHLVSIESEGTVYELSGRFGFNEIRNPKQESGQAFDAYLLEPFRYEATTSIISQLDYSEFATDYVQIDFVFGDAATRIDGPLPNTEFIIEEDAGVDGEPVFMITEDAGGDGEPVHMITEDSDTHALGDGVYRNLFNPHISLYYSDDGGVTFFSADVREFSSLGQYRWRMRWWQLGASRNRVYKLVVSSIYPTVVLGAVHSIRRLSGGAN